MQGVQPALALFDAGGITAVGPWSALLAAAEAALPLRERTVPRARRWRANAWLGALAAAVVRGAIVPALVAVARRRAGQGLLAHVPRALRPVVGLVALDGIIWLWHRANHDVALLWRFHAQHHTDPDLDVTTAARFHPGELVLSIVPRCAAVAALGVGPRTVVAYELLMQVATFFHHANLRLPAWLDRWLAAVVVTPRMHGIHHSRRPDELGSNWGVILTLWDRLAGTLRLDVPEGAITIGVPDQPPAAQATAPAAVLRRALSR